MTEAPCDYGPIQRRRMVLYPQGYPVAHRARRDCEALTHFCGGDLHRTFDLRRANLDTSLLHASKIQAFHSPHHAALCVLTETQDLRQVVETRCAYEKALAVSRSGAWALYWDPELDPHFPTAATREGRILGSFQAGAIWQHELGGEFLVLCPKLQLIELLPVRIAQIAGPAGSGVRVRRFAHSPLGVELELTREAC